MNTLTQKRRLIQPPMLLNEYLDENLLSTVMIKLKVDDKEDFCYTLWNQFNDQFHLLKEIGRAHV